MARFIYPIPLYRDGRPPQITSGWGSPRDDGKRSHVGVDLFYRIRDGETLPWGFPWVDRDSGKWFNDPKTPVLAAASGIVTAAGWQRGEMVVIDHGDGTSTFYTHMRNRRVNVGDVVRQGQILGTVGDDPKNSRDGAHLHFEIRQNGTPVDPEPIMRDWPKVPWVEVGASPWVGRVAFVLFGGALVLAVRRYRRGRALAPATA